MPSVGITRRQRGGFPDDNGFSLDVSVRETTMMMMLAIVRVMMRVVNGLR